MSDEEIIEFSKDQRLPEEGEPICVVCGKYGAYVCDKTDEDVCSIECKNILLQRVENTEENQLPPVSCDDETFYHWRISAYYKYMTWSTLYTNKDVLLFVFSDIRRGLNISVNGDFYHSCSLRVISFDDIQLMPQLRENLIEMGVISPTPIQMESIPCILSNRDVILRSNTGSGKTLAYLIPLLLLLIDYYETYSVYTDFVILIVVPSRELAIQIEEVVKFMVLKLRGVRTALIIGGESREQQMYRLRQDVNVLICTPGRLSDIASHDPHGGTAGEILKRVRSVVLDEADQLMKSDFQDQVLSLFSHLISRCLQVTFKIVVSATITANLRAQILPHLQNPMEVTVCDIQRLNSTLQYSIQWCEENQKKKKFVALMKKCIQDTESLLQLPLVILCQTRMEVVDVQAILASSFPTVSHNAVTVETPFVQRREIIQQFQTNQLEVLVSTPGIVGRGIELRSANSILLWSFASSVSEFIHNVGRIGREGNTGSVCVFCNAHNKKIFQGFVKLAEENHIKIPSRPLSSFS
ncbi:putative ATP-dependent RNA helicase [Blastocystis sp. subtype 4]|uniref:putative ATP-dependent RNA helicase n=1 Tax=Blastocystis sp. subtype 4 TaxID=944170 RepID=UPI000711E4F0|nr:putative ATP-dependent RNA helicase [Blastocystis sp. subtype 4]KNB43298.1 putative ATP-dependent RNA helicase [Blastocystis sp. subtype 4]|eukprot:XP_014526733.1 putative ATP-dependent RNA helicase [Blastocystis sp. subtype 4]